jgi:ABC-type multidrug transport system fused ATPase/permease subunit
LLLTYITKLFIELLLAGGSFNGIISLSAVYIGILIGIQFSNSINKILFNSVFAKADHLFECRVHAKLSELPMSYIDSSQGKTQINNAKHTKATAVYTAYRSMQIVTYFYRFTVAFIILVKFNILFSFLFLILTIPGVVFKEFFEKKMEEFRIKSSPDIRKLRYYRWMLVDSWPAKDVRMYDLTESIKKRYSEEKNIYISSRKKLEKKKVCCFMLSELVFRLGEILFIAFVVYMCCQKLITIGEVTYYIGMATTVSLSFKSLSYNIVTSFNRATREMPRLFKFFAFGNEKSNKSNIRKLENFENLEFKNVYFKYPYTEKYVLTGVSFTVNKGDKLSIVGINGSGKSTLVKLMLGLYEIESGQILINGYPMSDYDIQDVRKLFSALFQSFVQYPLTLRENIAFSAIERINNDEEIESALIQSGVYEDIQPKLEKGLNSFMTRQFADKGTELSKGQWQKIALSRAYFKNAPIIIFDEPSAALDAEAEDRIFKNFESISDGKIGIMISHRISSARMSNKIIVLDGGKITEQGTHEELVSLNGLYAKLYNLQREKYTVRQGE